MSRVKQSLKQTGESTADKKAKITREERALIREQEKLWNEKKRTIKRAVKGQDKLKRIRDKATLIVPESIPYDGYYDDPVLCDTRNHHKAKIEWKNVLTAGILMVFASLIIVLCVMVLAGEI